MKMMKGLSLTVVGVALAVLAGCSNPTQASVSGNSSTSGSAGGSGVATVSVTASTSPGSPRSLISDSTVTKVLFVAIQNGTSEGSGTLTPNGTAWTGSFQVQANGPTDFWAYAYNASDAVVWSGLTSGFTVNSTGTNSVSIPMSQLANETSANIGTLVPVAGGTFTMLSGGPNMTESTFHMSANLITGAEYASVTGLADPSNFRVVNNHPVETVSWYAALVFCNDLSIKEGLTPVYSISGNTSPSAWGTIPTVDNTIWDAATVNSSANGYRLPTEMEYMWAAMGGMSDGLSSDLVGGVNTGGYNKGYAGSTEAGGAQTNIGTYAWYSTNSAGTTHPVGMKLPNELGIYDLSGNVYEWCWDLYGSYPTTAQTNYQGPASGSSGTYRVFCSGSWSSFASFCAVVFRGSGDPISQNYYAGFRVVRS